MVIKVFLISWGLKHYVRRVLEVSKLRDLFWDKCEGRGLGVVSKRRELARMAS